MKKKTLFFFSLYSKTINCLEDVTFSDLVDAFYHKAKKKGFHDLNLEFTRRLSKNLKGIVDAYRKYNPMSEDDTNKLLKKVPSPLKYKNQPVRDIFRASLNKLASQQDKIAHLSQRICSENGASVIINRYVAYFDLQYQNWYADNISKTQLQIIKKDIQSMENVCNKIRDQFDRKLSESEEKRKSIHNLTSSIDSMFNELLQETVPIRVMKCVFKLRDSIHSVNLKQDQLLIIYTDMIGILIEYNQKRSKWAGLLIEGTQSSH